MIPRSAIILVLLLGALPLNGSVAVAAKTEAPARCCCCPAGACQCGCEAPAREDTDEPKTPRLCVCDNVPMGMPSAPVRAPQQVELCGTVDASVADVRPSRALEFLGHQPHGPPQTLRILATIVLLN